MDELKQELLSKAKGIQPTPKSTLIQEGIEKWLPMVMGVAGPPGPKYPPFKVPPLPTGTQLLNEAEQGITNLRLGQVARGTRLLDRSSPDTIRDIIKTNPHQAQYFDRVMKDPIVDSYVTYGMPEKLWQSGSDDPLVNRAMQHILRFLAD